MNNIEHIFIFDIDGCIMKSIFPNIHDNDQDRDQIIKEVNEYGKTISLFSDFIHYYKLHCTKHSLVFFITGRQDKPFRALTEYQLRPLQTIKPYFLVFYPLNKEHTAIQYFQWKVNMIFSIFKLFQSIKNIIFHIFDDMVDYFDSLRIIVKSMDLTCHLHNIYKNDQWQDLNRKHKKESLFLNTLFRQKKKNMDQV